MTTPPASIPAAQLRADGISKSFHDRRVLTDVSFTAAAGERVGLIGENGSGKTTLLRILAGALEPDAGSVCAVLPGVGAARVGLLHQLVPFAPADTVGAAVEGAVAPARAAIAAMERAAAELAGSAGAERAAADYAGALADAERLGAWETDARISAMLAGLSLGAVDLDRKTGTLSGGQRSRLALAWLLLSAPDILVLDEPTNDLDDQAAEYLHRHLEAFSGPVIFASHDRAFLDEVATTLLDLDPAPLPHAVAGPLSDDGPGTGIAVTAFTGSYTDYLGARLDAREKWERQYRDEQAELKRLRASIRDSHVVGHADFTPRTEVRAAQKFYADRNAKVVSRRVNDARSRYADLEERQVRKPPGDLVFRGLTAGGDVAGGGGAALAANRLRVAGRLAPVTFDLQRGDKLLVTGENGSGKSTLLTALAGELKAHVQGRLSKHKYPRWIVFVDDLPKNDRGKVDKKLLIERDRRGELPEIASPRGAISE